MFHLEVPGGIWHTVTTRPTAAAKAASSVFQAQDRQILEPSASAVIISRWRSGSAAGRCVGSGKSRRRPAVNADRSPDLEGQHLTARRGPLRFERIRLVRLSDADGNQRRVVTRPSRFRAEILAVLGVDTSAWRSRVT